MIVVEVAVVAPVWQSYSYLLPEGFIAVDDDAGTTLIGRRVFVPFGSSLSRGYIIGVETDGCNGDGLKEIQELIDDEPLFREDMVPLLRWLASYYHYPIGRVITTSLPGGLRTSGEMTLCLTNGMCENVLADKCREYVNESWFKRLLEKGALSAGESKQLLADRQSKVIVERLRRAGFVKAERSRGKDTVGKKLERCYRLDRSLSAAIEIDGVAKAGPDDAVDQWFQKKHARSVKKAELKTVLTLHQLSKSAGSEDIPRRELLDAYPYSGRIIDTLLKDGVIEKLDRRIYRSPFGDLLPFYPPVGQLSEEQQESLKTISRCLDECCYRTFLLYGITGSGKTEVYLRAAEKTLELGRGVLVLVPEIALATQIEAHFVSRFGEDVALLHSGLSPGQRYDEWSRVYNGQAKIVVGARSAVFAPFPNLGLVVVDEEHDSSYKQQDGLRYHARDVAIMRARMKEATVILGSATPAVTSFYNGRSGKYEMLTMRRRVGGRNLPEVEIVDLKNKSGMDGGLFHPILREALAATFASRKQSILLINRRGFSSSVICLDCGAMLECRYCKVTMNLHKASRSLLCHYCGFRLPEGVSCAGCGSQRLHPLGFGTERVSEELAGLLPDARIARLDSDTASDRKAFLTVLQAARRHEIDVLVGTQMLAKGLHFPEVTLVGIVMAESGLGFPDYRASEKTYQLIAQVTGRAGRGDTPGRVIIQSLQPDHYAIKLAAAHRYETLVDQEIAIRQQAGFPPYSRLVFVLVEDRQSEKARQKAIEIARAAREWLSSDVEGAAVTVFGPAPAAIERLRDRYRWHIMLKGKDMGLLHRLTEYLMITFQRTGQERVTIDVDPDNML